MAYEILEDAFLSGPPGPLDDASWRYYHRDSVIVSIDTVANFRLKDWGLQKRVFVEDKAAVYVYQPASAEADDGDLYLHDNAGRVYMAAMVTTLNVRPSVAPATGDYVIGVDVSDTSGDGNGKIVRFSTSYFATLAGDNEWTGDNFFTGSLVRGHTASIAHLSGNEAGVQNHDTTAAGATMVQARWANVSFGCSNWGGLSRGASIGTHAIVQDNDIVAQFGGMGSDGVAFQQVGLIRFEIDGTPGTNDMPGAASILLTPDGSTTPAEVWRVQNNGQMVSQPTYDNTVTGSSVEVTSAGLIGRTSSTRAGKTDFEPMETARALDALKAIAPQFFRRTSSTGDLLPDWSFYGFLAEDAAAVDSRFARHATTQTTYEEIVRVEEVPEIGADGETTLRKVETLERVPVVTPLETPVPQDIDRDALMAAMWTAMRNLVARVEELERAAKTPA